MNRIDTKWLKVIAENEDYWANNVFSDYPTVIALEYDDLRELAGNGQIQGVVDQLRDLYEKLMKYPAILTLCYLQEKSNNNKFLRTIYYDTISEWISKEQSTGDWNNLIRDLARINQKVKDKIVPEPLVVILKETYKLLNKPIRPKSKSVQYANFCNWRNDVIGHGALRDVKNENQREEIVIMLNALKEYFQKEMIEQAYKHVNLYYKDELLVGVKRKAWSASRNVINLSIDDNILMDKFLYISYDDERIYFFDSYSYRRNKCKYIGYKGIVKTNDSKDIRQLTERIDKTVNNKVLERLTKEKYSKDIYSIEASKALDDLEKAETNYIVIPEIDEWLNDIFQNKCGCFEIVMDSGMGKSALSSYLMQQKEINGEKCIIRTYHFSRMKLYGIKDFISQVNLLFASIKNENNGNDLWLMNDDVKLTDSYDLKWSKKSIASYLNYFHEKSSYINNKKTILVLDGIDELESDIGSENNYISKSEFIKCLPKDDDLCSGVFVLYMTRPADKVSKTVSETINSLPVMAKNIMVISKEMPGYVEALKKFINCGDATKEIISVCHKSFLEAKLYIELYNATGIIRFDYESNLIGYLDVLKNKYYGNEYYNIIIKKYLLYLIILKKGATIEALKELTNTTTELLDLIGALYDLSPILTKERETNGTVYRLANNMYYSVLNQKYYDDIMIIKDELRDSIIKLGSKAMMNITFDCHYEFNKDDTLYSCIILENVYDIFDENIEDIRVLSALIIISICCRYRFEYKKSDIIFIQIIEKFISKIPKCKDECLYQVFLALLIVENRYSNIVDISNEQIHLIDDYISNCFVTLFSADNNDEEVALILMSLITEYGFYRWNLIMNKLDECNMLEKFSSCVLRFPNNSLFKNNWFVNLKLYIDDIFINKHPVDERYNNMNCMSINFLFQNTIYWFVQPKLSWAFSDRTDDDCIRIGKKYIGRLKTLKHILQIQEGKELSFDGRFLKDNLSKNEIQKIDIDEADRLFYDLCTTFFQLSKDELEHKFTKLRRGIFKDYQTRYQVMLPNNITAIIDQLPDIFSFGFNYLRARGFNDFFMRDSKKIMVSRECYFVLKRLHNLQSSLENRESEDVEIILDDLYNREYGGDEIFIYLFSKFAALNISKLQGYDLKEHSIDYGKLEQRYLELLHCDGISRVLDRYFIAIQLLVLSDICLDYQKAKDMIQRINDIQTELKDYVDCGAYKEILDSLFKRMHAIHKLHFFDKYTNKKILTKETGLFITKLFNVYYKLRFDGIVLPGDSIYEDIQNNNEVIDEYFIDKQMYSPYNQSWKNWSQETSKNMSLIILYINSSIRLVLPEMFRGYIYYDKYYYRPFIYVGNYTVDYSSYIESIRISESESNIECLNYCALYKCFSVGEV